MRGVCACSGVLLHAGFPGVRVISNCKIPKMGSGNGFGSSVRAVHSSSDPVPPHFSLYQVKKLKSVRNNKYASYNQYTWKYFNSVHINTNIFLTWKFSHNFYFKTEWTEKNSFHFQANPDWEKNLNIFSIVASVGNLMFLNYLYIHFPKTKRNDLGAKSTTLKILLLLFKLRTWSERKHFHTQPSVFTSFARETMVQTQ